MTAGVWFKVFRAKYRSTLKGVRTRSLVARANDPSIAVGVLNFGGCAEVGGGEFRHLILWSGTEDTAVPVRLLSCAAGRYGGRRPSDCEDGIALFEALDIRPGVAGGEQNLLGVHAEGRAGAGHARGGRTHMDRRAGHAHGAEVG